MRGPCSLPAVAVLSLLTTVASLNTKERCCFRSCARSKRGRCLVGSLQAAHRNDHDDVLAQITLQKSTSNQARPNSSTSTTSTTLAQSSSPLPTAPTSSSIQRRRRRTAATTATRPPMVDSNLLRFIEAQKRKLLEEQQLLQQQQLQQKQQSASDETTTNNEIDRNTRTTLSDENAGGTSATTMLQNSSDITISDDLTSEAEEATSLETLDASERTSEAATSAPSSLTSSWLGQYNSHRIALFLTSRDETLDASQAALAGERVQSTVLGRTARRQIRSFLKQRDQEWRGTSSSSSIDTQPEQTTGRDSTIDGDNNILPLIDSTTQPPSSATYGLEEVVDVLLSFGLSIKDITEIFIHTPGVALMKPHSDVYDVQDAESISPKTSGGESLQKTVNRAFVELLCGTLKLRKYDARKVLRNCPGLLTMRGSKSAEQIVVMLAKLGVSTNSIARDKAALPTLLSRSPSAVFRLIAFLSSDAVRMPMSQIGPLLRRAECQPLLDIVAPVPPRLGGNGMGLTPASSLSQEELWPDEDDLSAYGTVSASTGLVSDPDIAALLWGRSGQLRRDRINNAYRNMSKTAWTLRHEIGTADLGKVISAYPSVLLHDADKQIMPAADYLMNELGIWKDDLPRVLQLYPVLLGMDIADMERVASYLMSLDVGAENLASIFRSFPALLTLDVEKDMEPVVDFLRSIGIANVGRFISRLPPVVGYSVERELRPKWEYLEAVLVDPRFEVSRFPAYFSYPLERVIKTRIEYLRDVKQVPIQLLAVDQILRFGDNDFATKVANDHDKGVAFRKFADERQAELRAIGRKQPRGRRPTAKKHPSTQSEV